MSARPECPYCGRRLPRPSQVGPIVCDGCERQFNPALVRYEPPPLSERILGVVLLCLGVVALFAALQVALKFDFRSSEIIPKLIGTFVIPVICLFGGRALATGRRTVERSAPAPQGDISPAAGGSEPIDVQPESPDDGEFVTFD